MKLLKLLALLVVIAGVGVYAQTRREDRPNTDRAFSILAGRGAQIGVSIRDTDADDKTPSGVVVEDVQAESAAEKAGIKRADVIVEFDGEKVRSARQFTRLVSETPAGHSVKATIVRDGQKKDVQITPSEDHGYAWSFGPGMNELQGRLGDLNRLTDRMPFFNYDGNGSGGGTFNYNGRNFMMPYMGRGRLGVSVEEMTPQLGAYFGVKDGDGVLVSSVTDDSPAAKAGLKAGDVITKINGESIKASGDVVSAVDKADNGELKIVVVREKKEMTLTAKIEPRRPARRGEPA